MSYKDKLDAAYLEVCATSNCPTNKLSFLGNYIFDFTTYDSDMDERFAKMMLEVIEPILDGTAYEYQKDEISYLNYLLMVNMPFLVDKIEWGTSIRGAWFEETGIGNDEMAWHLYEGLIVPRHDLKNFMRQLIEWSKAE